eukprot:CAMPEP_0201662460 /NCGR_PEP_ID=MMETSP0494-20130426/4535_1 /ASSEMBLY_ACC=CAM_ASM_000839 /TAXON_ID=420259 /ORGANISM="Thalassiosira gravida, Strain GMp14c1" /LENGTH=485 /DNA_ID=CAMNT_0048140823 /DNA_START=70 /DNA_END=1527 /DNA_ORIENTATION=-
MNLNTDILTIRNGSSISSSSFTDNNNTSQTVIDVGTPRHPTGWSTTTIRYHNFTQLPSKKGESYTDSRPFRAHGLDWYLRIHPGGAASSNSEITMVSLYLRCKSAAEQNVSIQAEFSLALLREDGQIDSMMSCPCNAFRRKRKGWPNFIGRERVLDRNTQLLDECGTLTVIVKVQLFQERDTNFVPGNGLNLIRLLKEANISRNDNGDNGSNNSDDNYYLEGNDAEQSSTADTADVKFIVEGETIHAHRLILKLAAPALAHLCEDVDEDDALPIIGVRSSIFQGVLRFAYGDTVPPEVWTAVAATDNDNNNSADDTTNDEEEPCVLSTPSMEILDAANRFGVVDLKILAETKVAESDVRISTASDLILYADAKDCPLLKERVVDYFVANAELIRKHPSFGKVKESASILDELMEAYVTKRILRSFSSGEEGDDVDYESMGVNLLRRKLDGRGLDVDGSREMLIQRLEVWDDRKRVGGVGIKEGGS